MKQIGTEERILVFADLLTYLRHQGFDIGVGHYLRLQEILNMLGPDCQPFELKYLLCPLFATSEKQQQQFYRAFDSYLALKETPAAEKITREESGEQAVVTKPSEPVGTKKWPYYLLGLLILLAIGIFAYVTQPGRTALDQLQSPVPVISGEPGGAGFGARFLSFYSHNWPVVRLLGIAAPLIMFLLTEVYRLKRRKLAMLRQRGKKPPFVYPIQIETPDLRFFRSEIFFSAGKSLRKRIDSEVFRLDVDRTVKNTIDSAGFPTFHYKSMTRPPEYLVLIDMPFYRDHFSRFADTIIHALEKEDIFVKRYFYEVDPRVVFSEVTGRRIYLADLKFRFGDRRLILFGNGAALLDPVSGRMDKWTRIFESWHDRAILTPEPAQIWRNRELLQLFAVFPASLEGLSELAEYFLEMTPGL